MAKYLLAIDQGTTGTRCVVVDKNLSVKAKVGLELRQIYPKPGWVEHDLGEIWATVEATIPRALRQAGIKPREIAGIGIANQRETTAVWDRRSSNPIHNAIVWQCRRTEGACKQMRDAGQEPLVRERAGLVIDPYFSATKIAWLLDNVKGGRARADRGELAFGTIDTFLAWKLTGGEAHVTDVSNASRTSLLNLRKLEWDPDLLSLFGIPREVLPQVRGSSEVLGTTRGTKALPDGIPIAGMAGDQQAALFGQACFEPGDTKCTYGTGAFVLMNTGSTPVLSEHRLLSTVAWKLGSEVAYALEGSAFIAGAAVQWLRDSLKLIKNAAQVEELARTVKDSGEVVFVPALAGLGAPHWRADARGVIAGLTRATGAGHIARATLEGIAFVVNDLMSAMREDAGRSLTAFKVDGGAAANDLLLQFQADLLNLPIVRPRMIETTAFGAAFLAGLATGVWSSKEEIRGAWKTDRKFVPRMREEERTRHLAKWRRAVAMSCSPP
jgi:glycerol kinase